MYFPRAKDEKKPPAERIYLPAGGAYGCEGPGVPADREIQNYVAREFPLPTENQKTVTYSIPHTFIPRGKPQASRAEEYTHVRLSHVSCPPDVEGALWQVCFQGACYGGRSFRNERDGKLMMREHDFVIFNIFQDRYFVTLVEVKSTCDISSTGQIVSNPVAIKNNKRSGLHQLRDHMEILEHSCNIPKDSIQCFLFWPFLTMWTKDPLGQKIRRWKEEANKHIFTDTISEQRAFNEWYFTRVLSGRALSKQHFQKLFKRFIIMSCGVFVNEIHDRMLALLSQEQVSLLHRKPPPDGSPTIVHGAAGTGKTLLVLHKLQLLHETGLLNENNRALYICYWPGIRADFRHKLEKLKLSKFVDTTRFFISQEGFLHGNASKYRHIYMDESEAICLSFTQNIITQTFDSIAGCRLVEPDAEYETNESNSNSAGMADSGYGYIIKNDEIVKKSPALPNRGNLYGDLWYLVDINQAALFLPKYSPTVLKHPDVILTRVIRNTGTIYKVFSQFYKNPIPAVSQLADLYFNSLRLGHNIDGPPIYWVNSDNIPEDSIPITINSKTFKCLIRVIVDLCTAKGVKMNDLCVIPFVVTHTYLPESINSAISSYFVTDGYKPTSIASVEEFLFDCNPNVFLVPWVLRVKGLEFKVLVIAIEHGDFDCMDSEDRRKLYIMASRCTCLLVLVCSEKVKESIDNRQVIQSYSFDESF